MPASPTPSLASMELQHLSGETIGIFPTLCSGTTTRLHLKDTLLSRYQTTFYVRSSSGKTVCRVNGEATSNGIKSSKVFLDAFGHALFTLKRKPWSLHQTHQAYSREGELLFSAKSKFSFTKTLMVATFKNEYDDRVLTVDITGKFTEGTAEMRLRDGRVLGRIGRHDGGTYIVEVSAGVDLALVTALAVAFNEGSQYGNKTAWTD